MAARGVFFTLTDEQDAALLAAPSDEEVLAFVEEIEESAWDGEPLDCGTDKAWDAMHRCLSDGTLGCGRRLDPLDMAVLGGEHRYHGEDYLVAHLRAPEVREVAAALEIVDETWLRHRYDRIDPTDYQGVLGDDDFDYTWSNFEDVREFYRRAAEANLAVIFTVDR